MDESTVEQIRGAPYRQGDRVAVTVNGLELTAVVSMAISTSALDPRRRWRLLCRWDDQAATGVSVPLYCGDDGTGQHVRPL